MIAGLIVFLMVAVLVLGVWVDILRRRLATSRDELDAVKRGQIDLIAENLEQTNSLRRLTTIERDFYLLRRDHSRADATIARLVRMQTGVTAICENLDSRLTGLAVERTGSPEWISQLDAVRQQVVALLDWSRRLSVGEAVAELPRHSAEQTMAIDTRLRAVG